MLWCLVIDDASLQPIDDVVREIGDDRIESHRFKENRGANVARNWGISQAKGKYIAFLDDDDRWLPSKLEKQVSSLSGDSSIGLTYTGQQFVDEDGETIETKSPTTSGDMTRYLLKGGYVGGYSSVMVRKELIESVGKPDPELPILQDRDWWLKLSEVCRRAQVTPDMSRTQTVFESESTAR
ncbi:glycosyltransferase family A protein [Halostagnicola sp. A56]|uniref:glycosyltransferase family 2 protein n=1 Tax=Halostagnicola sp. A56 TaxID=1495067 RepID=UPI0009E26AEE